MQNIYIKCLISMVLERGQFCLILYFAAVLLKIHRNRPFSQSQFCSLRAGRNSPLLQQSQYSSRSLSGMKWFFKEKKILHSAKQSPCLDASNYNALAYILMTSNYFHNGQIKRDDPATDPPCTELLLAP